MPPHFRERDSPGRIDTFEQDSYEENPIILESEVKAALEVVGRNRLLGVDGIPIDLFQTPEIEFVKMLPRICQ